MPRYRTEHGVVVNIPAEKAARIGGLIPADLAPPPQLKADLSGKPPRKAATKRAPKG